MVMIGCDEKYFFTMTRFLARDLDNHRKNLPDVDERDDDENNECIGHQRHDRESSAETESTRITEIELGGLDIEPEKCRE